MATRDGLQWLPDQVDTILDQAGVNVRIVVSDDGSTDGSREWLGELASNDHRVLLLSPATAGSAASNFYRLLIDAQLADGELVAFADQDDVWLPGKLVHHATMMQESNAEGVSSNVTAFHRDGRRWLVRKDFPQRALDYLLESPGPGSTFLITKELAEEVAHVLAEDPEARLVEYHDWLVYAVARAKGRRWIIDARPSVDYRQHSANVMGANVGSGAALSRLLLIRTRWHRNQAARLARIAERLGAEHVARVRPLLESRRFTDRMALARIANQLRRRPRDRAIIAALIATGIW